MVHVAKFFKLGDLYLQGEDLEKVHLYYIINQSPLQYEDEPNKAPVYGETGQHSRYVIHDRHLYRTVPKTFTTNKVTTCEGYLGYYRVVRVT